MKRRARAAPAAPNAPPASGERVRRLLLGATAALHVAWPLLPGESIAWTGDGLMLAAAWCALGLAWTAGAWRWSELAPRWSKADVALAVFLALYAIGGVAGAMRSAPRPALNVLFGFVALGWGYWLPRQLLRHGPERRAVVAVMMGVACGVAFVGLHQFFVSLPADRAAYQADPDAALRAAGLWYPPGSRERALYEQRLASLEPFGTFSLANSLAGFLAPWLIVAGSIAMDGTALDAKRRSALLALVAAPTGLALLLAKSRSAAGAVVLGAAALVARQGRSRRTWTILAAVCVAVAILIALAAVLGGLDLEVVREAPKSLGYRWQYWQATLGVIGESPWLGCGPGAFDDAYLRHKSPLASEEIKDPHNFVLEIAATVGLPAAAALLVGLGLVFASGDDRDHPPNEEPGGQRAVLLGAVAAFAFVALIGPSHTTPPDWLELALVAAGMAVAIAIVWPWIASGRLSSFTLRTALAVLLVNLLAAGGIAFPGVASSVWLLAALVVSLGPSVAPLHVGGAKSVLAILAATAVFLAVEWLGVIPVLSSQGAVLRAESERRRRVEHLRAAVEADRFGTEGWQRLMAHWIAHPAEASSEDLDAAARAWLSRRPRSATAHTLIARAYRAAGQPDLLAKSVEHLEAASRLYPTSPSIAAELAQGAAAVGRADLAKSAAETALRLDAATPHADVKLSEPLRKEMQRLAQ